MLHRIRRFIASFVVIRDDIGSLLSHPTRESLAWTPATQQPHLLIFRPVLRPQLTVVSFTRLMQSTATTVAQYLAELPAERRSTIERVRAVILQNLDPVFEEGMQYGMIGYYVPHRLYPAGYHCDPSQPLPFVALASQKNYISVYLGCVYSHPENARWFRAAWAKTGKKLDLGKSCLRFKQLDDLALDVIGEVIRRTPARAFIEYYEAATQNLRRHPVPRSAAPPAKAKVKPKQSPSPRMKTKPKTMAAYLAGTKVEQRACLKQLRKIIRAVAPTAEEGISYGLATFRLNGRPLAAFGAWANHCAFYPMSSATVKAFQDQLKGFETSKGAIRFTPEKPLPVALVKKLVKARIAESSGKFVQ
jgi:uncharacterized protein YdhG (YjbR/CyaY superfamily)